MKSWQIPRRTFLKGAGTSILLPALDIMMPTDAFAADALKPRFAALFMPMSLYGEGCDMSKTGSARYYYAEPFKPNAQGAWRPATTGALGSNLPIILQPLADLRSKFSIVSGLSTMPGQKEDGSTHSLATSSWLTSGWASIAEATVKVNGKRRSDAPPTSVDQYLANFLKYTAGSTIVFNPSTSGGAGGGQEGDGGYMAAVSYNQNLGGNNIVPQSSNPKAVFDKLFKNCVPSSTPKPSGPTPQQQLHGNVLDNVGESIKNLMKKLGKDDNVRMQAYLQNIEDLQRSVSGTDPGSKPKECFEDDDLQISGQDWYNKVAAMVDVVAFAMASEAMPVATIMQDSEYRKGMYFSEFIKTYGDFEGVNGNKVNFPSSTWNIHNDVAHQASMKNGGGVNSIEQYLAYSRMQVQFMKRLITKLDSFPAEPNGNTPLNNSLLLLGTAHSNGNTHKVGNIPTLIAGGKRFGLKQGQHIALPMHTGLGHLHYTMLKSMGVTLDNFNGHNQFLSQVFNT